jgi:hypothetical protein
MSVQYCGIRINHRPFDNLGFNENTAVETKLLTVPWAVVAYRDCEPVAEDHGAGVIAAECIWPGRGAFSPLMVKSQVTG